MIKQRFKQLAENKGFSYTFICVLMIMLLMISLLIWEYIRLATIISNVQAKLESSLVTLATEKYDDMYASCRDGYATTIVYNGTYWTSNPGINISKVESEILNEMNSGEKQQVNLVKITNMSIQFTGKGTASGSNGDFSDNSGLRFKITAKCSVNLPFKLLWSDNFTVNIAGETQWISLY